MPRLLSFQSATPLLATVLFAACSIDAPTGPSRLQPDVLAGVQAANADAKRPGRVDPETFGNNLSNPVIFAEARGITGLSVVNGTAKMFENTGIRPTAEIDTSALAELGAGGTLPSGSPGIPPSRRPSPGRPIGSCRSTPGKPSGRDGRAARRR